MLVLVGSNSSTSINKQLTLGVLKQLNVTYDYLDLKSLDIPMFSEDLEREIKSPDSINSILEQINSANSIFFVTNEHNGSMSAFLKNILDWLSRVNRKFLEGKKVFVLSTSNGKRGGLGANEMLQRLVKSFGCEIYEAVYFPSFSENFDIESQKVKNNDLLSEIDQKLNKILNY